MDWEGLSAFLNEIKVFLVQSNIEKKDAAVDSLIDKCEFYISTSIKLNFNNEVDNNNGTYLNMAANNAVLDTEVESMEQSEYIDMDDYSTPPPATSPSECPYTGLPFAHLKLNKNVTIIKENMKISGKKSTVTCALLKGSWLLYYSSSKPNALKPSKYFLITDFEVSDQPLELILTCSEEDSRQKLQFDSGTLHEMWIKAIREELKCLEDDPAVYDDPNNLRMDEHLYKTLHFNYDIPKMPPKPVQQLEANQPKTSSNRAEFQLKYHEIKEQLASQLKQQKSAGGVTNQQRSQRSNSVSPQKKFGRFISMFRSSASSSSSGGPSCTANAALPDGAAKKSPEKIAKIMKYKRNTTIFSPDYEIVGS